MTIRELADQAQVAFGFVGGTEDGDVVLILPHGHFADETLIWTCERKHMDDETIKAHDFTVRENQGYFRAWLEWLDLDRVLTWYTIVVPREVPGVRP